MKELLDQDDYKIIKRNPTNKLVSTIKKALENILESNNITPELAKRLIPKNPTLLQIYGLPKIRKKELPLRPIVCMIGSATYNLAKELNRILFPLVGRTDSFVNNSSHFVNIISQIHLEDNDLLVSFDVKSLFTRVPINDALIIIKDRLLSDSELDNRTTMSPHEICILVELCLKSTFFSYEYAIYEQTDGTAMGSPLSPTVANIFMEDFENTSHCYLPPILYSNYHLKQRLLSA